MRLNESQQEDIIASFRAVLDKYKEFKYIISDFKASCIGQKNLESESDYLDDFVTKELGDKLESVQDAILDEYYPIDYADDEDDYQKAGERYRTSSEARKEVFDKYW